MPISEFDSCVLCGRACGVDRSAGFRGYCGETDEVRIATASIHRGEEPPVTGIGGSGTIFVTGCALRCAFCQNYQISQQGMGAAVDPETFARICLELERRGAENINIVTGSHALPALAPGLRTARAAGLAIPILWNSSGYESVEMLDRYADLLQVYLPDLKTLDPELADEYFRANEYPAVAAAAVTRMAELRPLRFAAARTSTGAEQAEVIVSGTIVRHLVIPSRLDSTRGVLRWFAEHLAGKALLSLMTQYTPVHATPGTAIPDRYVNQAEFDSIHRMLDEFGIEDGFYQELVIGNDWLPDFERINPFSSDLSVPVWHWKCGFISL